MVPRPAAKVNRWLRGVEDENGFEHLIHEGGPTIATDRLANEHAESLQSIADKLNQQPKLKTLKWSGDNNVEIAHTSFGSTYYVYKDNWVLAPEYSDRRPCISIEDGKQLAQADFEKRVNELYV